MEANSQNTNTIVNNNLNNITVEVKVEQSKKKIVKKKKEPNSYKKWGLWIVGSIIIGGSIPYVKAGVERLSREAKDNNIIDVLDDYAEGLNDDEFDANEYFAPKVTRFFKMEHTNPSEINDYVNGLYRKQFKDATSYFDKESVRSAKLGNGDYEASVMMYSTYYNISEQKQYEDYKTKIELIFDRDFKIKFFRQHLLD